MKRLLRYSCVLCAAAVLGEATARLNGALEPDNVSSVSVHAGKAYEPLSVSIPSGKWRITQELDGKSQEQGDQIIVKDDPISRLPQTDACDDDKTGTRTYPRSFRDNITSVFAKSLAAVSQIAVSGILTDQVTNLMVRGVESGVTLITGSTVIGKAAGVMVYGRVYGNTRHEVAQAGRALPSTVWNAVKTMRASLDLRAAAATVKSLSFSDVKRTASFYRQSLNSQLFSATVTAKSTAQNWFSKTLGALTTANAAKALSTLKSRASSAAYDTVMVTGAYVLTQPTAEFAGYTAYAVALAVCPPAAGFTYIAVKGVMHSTGWAQVSAAYVSQNCYDRLKAKLYDTDAKSNAENLQKTSASVAAAAA